MLIKNKHGLVCHGFLLESKILYLEPKYTFEEFETVRNKHQDDSANGYESDYNDSEAMILSSELHKGLNQRSS